MSQVSIEPEFTPEVAEVTHPEPASSPASLALSVDEFAALEERVLRAVNLVKRERASRTAAEEQATLAETKFSEQSLRAEQLQAEVNSLRVERDHVRQRVERLLSQLDALEI